MVFLTFAVNMQIIDEKSLIKKYQNEIRCLKEELEQLKRGIVTVPQMKDNEDDDILRLKQKVCIEQPYIYMLCWNFTYYTENIVSLK